MGPNKPCQCGSGKKQKKCHPNGAPLYGPEPEPLSAEARANARARAAGLMTMVQTLAASLESPLSPFK